MFETSDLSNFDFLSGIKIVAADIDYTLTDFPISHNGAMAEIATKYSKSFSETTGDIFRLIEGQHKQKEPEKWDKREEFEKIIQRIGEIEKPSFEKYGVKKWSREAWMIIAAKKLGMDISPENLTNARDLYWETHKKLTTVYDDADLFIKELKKRRIPLILMTSSDSVMKINNDLTLTYEPEFSKSYKNKRVSGLPFEYYSVIIGDPIDKPKKEFFDIVLNQIRKKGNFDRESILFVGDSFTSDLKTPIELGYKGLLVKRKIE